MVTSPVLRVGNYTVRSRLRRSRAAWWTWFTGLLGISGLLGLQMVLRGPNPATIAWVLYWAGVVALFYRPRIGVYLIVGWTMMSDATLMYWYPFVKNLSSAESLMYSSRALIFSPLESYVVLTYLAWIGRGVARRKFDWRTGPLIWPTIAFAAFIASGLMYGVVRGGNLNVALWEVRGIFMLPALLVLVNNLIETPSHVSRLIWIATLALAVKSLVGTLRVVVDLNFNISLVESIADHQFSIHLCSMVILALAAWIYRASPGRRLVLTAIMPLMLFGIFANQRRAAFVSLGVGLLLLAAFLYLEHRRVFWLIIPVATLFAVIYIGAFWNSAGTLGMPARAVKSIIAPNSISARDAASNVYRVLENINTMFTIQSAPVLGIGFGQKFYRIVPLPDISFFVFYEYITHNSVMWIWMQAGAGAFFAMIYLIGIAVMHGARVVLRLPGDELSAIAAMATIYVVMHFVYAYVDMSWDAANMVYLGTMMGLICGVERVGRQMELAVPRCPWQAQPESTPGLRP